MGTEYRLLAPLGQWNRRFGTPAVALLLQGIIILMLIIGFAVLVSGKEGVRL